ncbi:MAG: tRNA pseudouridine(13) synthase TruD, partial [bacterium]
MKIKCLPEDFIVEEKIKIQFSKKPTNFLLFRINKKNITTFKAVNALNQTLKNIFKTPV